MQSALDAAAGPLPVRILAVDGAEGALADSYGMQGYSLPLLQDTPEGAAMAAWSARQHDVVILGKGNVALGLYSLSTHNLGFPAEYQELLEFLGIAAGG